MSGSHCPWTRQCATGTEPRMPVWHHAYDRFDVCFNLVMLWLCMAADPHRHEVEAVRLRICRTCPTRRWKSWRSRFRIGSVVSGVRFVIVVIRYLQWLCVHDAVDHGTQHSVVFAVPLSYFSKHFSSNMFCRIPVFGGVMDKLGVQDFTSA